MKTTLFKDKIKTNDRKSKYYLIHHRIEERNRKINDI